MEELESYIEEQMSPIEQTETDKTFEDDLYKKWFKAGSKSGFIAIRPWLEAGKISIDIGETGDSGLKGHTLVWTNAVTLATYLKAVYDGRGAQLYPASTKLGVPSPEGYITYGGGTQDGQVVARVLKIHHWQTGSGENASYDTNSFVWKCGHFKGRSTASGAVIPDTSSPLSVNLIKVTRVEMAEINTRMQLALYGFAAKEQDFFKALNGHRR